MQPGNTNIPLDRSYNQHDNHFYQIPGQDVDSSNFADIDASIPDRYYDSNTRRVEPGIDDAARFIELLWEVTAQEELEQRIEADRTRLLAEERQWHRTPWGRMMRESVLLEQYTEALQQLQTQRSEQPASQSTTTPMQQ